MIDFEDFAEGCPWATYDEIDVQVCSANRDDCGTLGPCYQEACGLMYALSKLRYTCPPIK